MVSCALQVTPAPTPINGQQFSMPSAKLLMIRPEKQARSFVSDLSQDVGQEIDSIFDPLIVIQPSGQHIDLTGIGGLIFTSANAVETFLSQSDERNLPAYCVGETTSNVASSGGLTTFNANGTASELQELVGKTSDPNTRLLYLRGDPCAFDLANALGNDGFSVKEAILYRQEETGFSDETLAVLKSEPVIVPVFSRNGFTALQSALDFSAVEKVNLIAISSKLVPPSFQYPNVQITVAPEPTRQSMIETIANMA